MKKILWSERIKRPPKALIFETYLRELDNPNPSHAEAREPRIVPLVVFAYGSVMARIRQMRYVGKHLVASVKEMARSANSVLNNPYAGEKTIDAETLKELEAYAHSLGVTDIDYTKVNPRHIFKGYKLLFPNAIVFTVEMNREKIKQAPSMPSFIEIFRTYLQLGAIVNQVSEFMRERGYNALAGPAIGGDVNYIPVAIDAGVGYSGKNGLLITRNNGPRIRLAAEFLSIYIREAHPIDGWWLGRRLTRKLFETYFPEASMDHYDPKTIEERRAVAGECETALQYGIHTYVDDMDDYVNNTYAAWPTRLNLMGLDGKVVYAGGLGPWGMKSKELKDAMDTYLESI